MKRSFIAKPNSKKLVLKDSLEHQLSIDKSFYQVPHEKRPKNVFGIFDNDNASASSGRKLAVVPITFMYFFYALKMSKEYEI